MAGRQVAGDGLSASLAGMSKNQLYDIMSQMKTLIEQNPQQARRILIQNPLLTKALFQAQIMLGMVKPPNAVPSILPPAAQHPQQSAQPLQQSNIQAPHALPGQVVLQDPTSASHNQTSIRKQHQNQPAMPMSSAAVPAVQSQPLHSHALQMPQQPKAHMNPPVTQISQPSSVPPLSHHSASQASSIHQPQMLTASSQLQQPLQSTGPPNLPLQPPLPPQPRPSSMQSFHHQYAPQMGPNVGFQHTGAQNHPSQPVFHSGAKPPANIGPAFPQGQPLLPNQPPLQSLYQAGGSHLGTELSNQVGGPIQVDRGSWMSGPADNSAVTQLPGAPSVGPGQMVQGNQPPRPASLSPEMEKALLQQVMSLTPDQINLLPPEQRNQVLQLQQILRQ